MSNMQRAEEAMQELIRCVNVMGAEEDVAEMIANVLSGSHRTLQQSFMRSLNIAMQDYANTGTDLRNEAAVDYAKKIVALEHYFPFV